MTKNKKNKLPPSEAHLKYEEAEMLGLSEKLQQVGWGGLTSKETGRIGGNIGRTRKRH